MFVGFASWDLAVPDLLLGDLVLRLEEVSDLTVVKLELGMELLDFLGAL